MSAEDEREEETESLPPALPDSSSSMPDEDASAPSSDIQLEVQKTNEEAASQTDVSAASADQQPQSECPDDQILEECVEKEEEEVEEGLSRDDAKGTLYSLRTNTHLSELFLDQHV